MNTKINIIKTTVLKAEKLTSDTELKLSVCLVVAARMANGYII